MTEEVNASEADLEARIAATLGRVFPGRVQLRHQQRFRLRVGHKEFEVGVRGYVDGKADILVYDGDAPLALLELKREGLALTPDDEAQAWSYAALACAPLVVLTNGADTRILLTHNRSVLEETSLSAAELATRLRTAAELAQVAINGAIDRLLGRDLAATAIEAINTVELSDQYGPWNGLEVFVKGFHVPRTATERVYSLLREPKPRAIVVSGAPLCGKSSVLREVVTTSQAHGMSAIFIDGSACSEGLFRRVSNVLANLFSWPATPDDARRWIQRLASAPDQPLVFCIDSPEANQVFRAELDEILTGNLGNVRLVLALDESQTDSWLLKAHRRDSTRLGRHSKVVTVGYLDDEEFAAASQHLVALGGHFVHGAAYALELRSPWVLRAAVAPRMEDLPEGRAAVLPPMLGLETLAIADTRFAQLGELRDGLERVARIYLEQTQAEKPDEQNLIGLYDYCISRQWLKARIDAGEIFKMTQAGLLQARTDADVGALYYVRVPVLFAKLLASRLHALTIRMVERGKSTDVCAQWLVDQCSRLPLGDLIGAEVVRKCVLDTSKTTGIGLVNGLLRLPPVTKVMSAGTKWITVLPNVGVLRMELDDKQNLVIHAQNGSLPPSQIPVDAGDLVSIALLDAWLILSQTRLFELELCHKDGESLNLAAWLLMQVGTCPVVLRRPSKPLDGYHAHQIGDIEMPCFDMGIVEPVTWAISELLASDVPGVDRDKWVKGAVSTGNLPLLGRVTQALRHLKHIEGLSTWAEKMLNELCDPIWKDYPFPH